MGTSTTSLGTKAGVAATLVAALGAAFVADHAGYHFTAQVLLVMVAAFGGAVLGALILRHPGHKARFQARRTPRAPTAAEWQSMAAIGWWEWDVRTEVLLWNEGMYAIYGVDPAVFTPTKLSILDFVAPQDVQAVLDTWTKEDASPRGGMLECHLVRPDGENRKVRFTWQTLDGDSEHPKVFGFAQDVTAMRAGRHDEAQLRGMVECSADYIWEYRLNAGLDIAHGLRLQNFGAEIVGAGKPLVDATSDHDFGLIEQAFAERVKFRDLIVPIIDAAGEPRWLSVSGHPQFDGAGDYYGYRGVGADVTERMRERDIAEGRRQAGAVGRLASGLAHEINNLLQPILIYSAFGADEAKAHEKLHIYFTRIARAAERATFIVKNVLSFARQTPPSHEDLNVVAAVRETIDLMSGTLGGRTQIDIVAADDAVIVRAERTGLAQIVTNLITNAADVMVAGGRIVVRVDYAALAGESAKAGGVAPGRYCRISVEDTGPGIAPDVVTKIFDPFFTTKPQGKGTGLGLAVVSGIAKSWGGGATVESTLGQGSRFMVYLPAPERELQAAQ